MASETMRGTTILGVRRGDQVVIAADGQVTLGSTVVKHGASKLRRLYGGKVIAGFAGATADAFTLFERFEAKLKDYHGNVTRAAVELAKDWRTDRALRRLEAMLLIADTEKTLLICDISSPGPVVIIKPSPPRFTAKMGVSWEPMPRATDKSVPSPPSTIMRSRSFGGDSRSNPPD